MAHGGKPPSPSASSVIPGLPSETARDLSSVVNAVHSGNPAAIFSSAMGMLSTVGGGSTQNAAIAAKGSAAIDGSSPSAPFGPTQTTNFNSEMASKSWSPFLLNGGGNTSAAPFSSPFTSLAALLKAPGGTAGFAPRDITSSGNASLSVDNVGAALLLHNLTFPRFIEMQ